MQNYLVVGAGLAGAVIANRLAWARDAKVTLIDRRDHLAGNCHTERCKDTGIMQHMHGAHIFHTSNKAVWDFVNQYADFRTFVNTPFAEHQDNYYPLPINLETLERFFKRRFTPQSAMEFMKERGDKQIVSPSNFREKGLMLLGEELYYAFFHGYTKKQWGRDPETLPASLLKRLPVRFTYNRSYYTSVYQGIPAAGYTEMVRAMLDHPNIRIELNTTFNDVTQAEEWTHIFYCGPIDEYYDYKFGRLRYRTVSWEKAIIKGDYFGHSSVNYPSEEVSYTRQREHKHYAYWEQHDHSIIMTEYSKETQPGDDPFYPLGLDADRLRFVQYFQHAQQEKRMTFIGRLATYRYLDMHQVIAESLELAKAPHGFPVFHPNVSAATGGPSPVVSKLQANGNACSQA